MGAEVEQSKMGFPLQYSWFSKIVTDKIALSGFDINQPVPPSKQFLVNVENAYCCGFLLKQSQHFKKWEERYIIINPDGLFSYKNPNESYSFHIKTKNAKYLWTRFDIQNGKLIIKLKHSLEQTEFGIPITDFCVKSNHNWLWAFYRMIMEKNIEKALD